MKIRRRVRACLCIGLAVLLPLCLFLSVYTVPLTLLPAENGTLYCTKTRAHLFSSAVVCLEPAPGYVVEHVFVNGRDCTERLERGRLRLRCLLGEAVVTADFAEAAAADAYRAVFV